MLEEPVIATSGKDEPASANGVIGHVGGKEESVANANGDTPPVPVGTARPDGDTGHVGLAHSDGEIGHVGLTHSAGETGHSREALGVTGWVTGL